MGDRRAEHGHHRVADELLDEAVVARDGLAEHLEQRILECAHLLGVEPLGQRGESGQVGKEHGDLPPVRVACAILALPLRPLPRRSAARTEGEIRLTGKAAARQANGCRRPHRGQKAKVADSSKPHPAQVIETLINVVQDGCYLSTADLYVPQLEPSRQLRLMTASIIKALRANVK